MERTVGFVDGIEMAGEEELERGGGADADAERLRGGAGQREVFDGGAGELAEFGGERVAHPVEAGKIIGAGVDLGPGDEEVAKRGGIHPRSQGEADVRRKR